MTLRHAIRVLLESPRFNGVVIVVLAVGIGATTAIFTIVNGVLLNSATLLVVLAFAAYLPARRAARVDPMRALRSE